MANGHDALTALTEEGRELLANSDLCDGVDDCPAHGPMIALVRFVARCQIVQLESTREDLSRKKADHAAMLREAKTSAVRWAVGAVLALAGAAGGLVMALS